MENNLKRILNEKGISYDKAARDMETSSRMVQYDIKADSLQSKKMRKWADYLQMEVNEIFKI